MRRLMKPLAVHKGVEGPSADRHLPAHVADLILEMVGNGHQKTPASVDLIFQVSADGVGQLAAELAGNTSFTASVKAAVEQGLPVYAECGGLIYLGRSLKLGETVYPMTSVLPADFVLEKKPQAHGYTQLETSGPNPFFEMKQHIRGHEFHYSRILNIEELPGMAFTMKRGAGIDGAHDGLVYKNVLATYAHVHALGEPHWAKALVRRAREYRTGRSREAS